ncbi:hypothetical protein ACQKND_16155 [Viridibacillus arvi]|uniref:hypothetical protein n=1 Tax=Viridibacillus arvi TaxID=263475 RepID=UPI003D06721E
MDTLFKETDKEYLIQYFKIPRKKFRNRRLLFAFIIGFMLLALGFRQNSLLYLAVPVGVFIGYKIPYYEMRKMKSMQDVIKQLMFPSFVRHFVSLIDTQGNVYQTLLKTTEYVKEPIKEQLEVLVSKLGVSDQQNREAFMEFAYFINSSEAVMIMSMIYEFDKEGIQKEGLKELEDILSELQENKVEEMLNMKTSSMGKFATPVIVYTIAFVLLFTSITFFTYFSLYL